MDCATAPAQLDSLVATAAAHGGAGLCSQPSARDRRPRVHTLLCCVQEALPTYLINLPPVSQGLEGKGVLPFSRLEKGRKEAVS